MYFGTKLTECCFKEKTDSGSFDWFDKEQLLTVWENVPSVQNVYTLTILPIISITNLI